MTTNRSTGGGNARMVLRVASVVRRSGTLSNIMGGMASLSVFSTLHAGCGMLRMRGWYRTLKKISRLGFYSRRTTSPSRCLSSTMEKTSSCHQKPQLVAMNQIERKGKIRHTRLDCFLPSPGGDCLLLDIGERYSL